MSTGGRINHDSVLWISSICAGGSTAGVRWALETVHAARTHCGHAGGLPPGPGAEAHERTGIATGREADRLPKIDNHPGRFAYPPGYETPMKAEAFPHYNPNAIRPFQVNLRSRNLSRLDLTGRLEDLLHAEFDTHTVWPPIDHLPRDFDWRRMLELGKNPRPGHAGPA